MNRTEAVAQVQEGLGFRTDLADRIATQLTIANTRLHMSATKPWWTIVKEYPLVTVVDNAVVAVPADFLEEYEEGTFKLYTADEGWQELLKNDFDELRNIYGTEDGTSEGYALVGDSFYLFPRPTEAFTLNLDYYRKDDDLSTGSSTNGYLTYIPEMLIGMAGLRIAQAIRDKEAITTFREMVAEARTELYRQNEAKKHANANYQMGGAH